MCLDIEHAVKVELIRCVVENVKEDGYSIVEKFFAKYPDILHNINAHASNPFCYDLIIRNQRRYSLWIILELISFGDLCKLYEFYEKLYPGSVKYPDILYDVRELRNAAAHNYCLLKDLTTGSAKARPAITKFISEINSISTSQRKSRLSNYFIKDFVSMLYFFNYIVRSKGIRRKRFEELKKLFTDRMLKHKQYFYNNLPVKLTYDFFKKVIDKLTMDEYNDSMN